LVRCPGIEPLRHDPRAVDERRVELAGGLLELGLDEVGVGAGVLAIEHPRADGDRIEDEARDVLAQLLALARELDRAGVVDDEAVDPETIALGSHLGEGETSGSFHDLSRRTVGMGPDGTATAPE
jgi:hypothetical protein